MSSAASSVVEIIILFMLGLAAPFNAAGLAPLRFLGGAESRKGRARPVGALTGDSGEKAEVVSVISFRSELGQSIVTSHTLDDAARRPQLLPGAAGYTFAPSTDAPDIGDKRLLKMMARSASALEKLLLLLRGTGGCSPSQHAPALPRTSPEPSPTIAVGRGAFISAPSSQENPDMTEIFTRLHLQYSRGVASVQYFNSHCSTIKPASLEQPLAKLGEISINSGICLFSKRALSVSPGHGYTDGNNGTTAVPPLPSNVPLTMYELEAITRLSSAVADIIGLVASTQNLETPMRVNIDIPDFEYYWIACDLLEQKLTTVAYAQGWVAAIDKRRCQLGAIMTSMLRGMLRDRHLAGVTINITSGTEAAVLLLKETIAIGIVPSLEEILSALRSRGQDAGLWRDFLDNLAPGVKPLDTHDLGRLMYVFKSVKPALFRRHSETRDSMDEAPPPKLTIQVDDINEWRILDRARSFLKTYGKRAYGCAHEPIIVGLFPMQKIFAAGPGRSDLYLKDPGLHMSTKGLHKRNISPLDVIGKTYGTYLQERLQILSLEAGLPNVA